MFSPKIIPIDKNLKRFWKRKISFNYRLWGRIHFSYLYRNLTNGCLSPEKNNLENGCTNQNENQEVFGQNMKFANRWNSVIGLINWNINEWFCAFIYTWLKHSNGSWLYIYFGLWIHICICPYSKFIKDSSRGSKIIYDYKRLILPRRMYAEEVYTSRNHHMPDSRRQ